ncbi:MAG TPA: hypothetical protein VIA18_09855 [Polyangia bacterium]|nr:hypothetical protein [Polyangia bacterium]
MPTVHQRLDEMTTALERGDIAAAFAITDDWRLHAKESWEPGLIANCRTWLRWTAGDKKGALEENEQQRILADPDNKTGRQLLHYWWDRAYLLAEAGRWTDAAAARAEFDRLADRPDDRDSRKTLEAWLLTMRGDGAGALAAARAVDTTRDDDIQDLYVLSRAFAAGGDAAGAERIRGLIRHGNRYPMKPVILREMKRDDEKAASRH